VRIPSEAVEVHLGEGSATLQVANQPLGDFGSISNSLSNGPSDPATASFKVRWHDVTRRRQVHNTTLHVAGLFLDTGASIHWRARNHATGFTFESESEGQTVVAAQLGHERNGVFFE
jgi:hypothetical protein